MTGRWASSSRSARLPANWQKLRGNVKRRAGGQCEAVEFGRRCAEPGTDCDHVIPNDDHDLANLQWLCGAHHKAKTARESAAAARVARASRPGRRRPREPHPGLIRRD